MFRTELIGNWEIDCQRRNIVLANLEVRDFTTRPSMTYML